MADKEHPAAEPASHYDWRYNKRIKKDREAGERLKLSGNFLWVWSARQLEHDDRILELGCGCGEFAARTSSHHPYLGLDFSPVGLDYARELCPDRRFEQAGIPGDLGRFKDFDPDVIVAIEFLEHIDEDLETLSHFPGKKIIATLPTFWTQGHVRWHETRESVYERYGSLIEITRFQEWEKNWGLVGFIK